MSDGVFISDRPQLAIARQTVSFASLGLNDPTLTRIIYEVGNPYLSYIPTDEFNPISGITEGKSYLLYLNAFFDGSPALANAVLTNLIPQTTTNVFADERVVFLCTDSVSFATAGITTGNTRLITLVSEGYFTSYDPNDTINGIDSFVEGELYDIDPITDIDLHLYGVTEIRYSDEVLYLDSLEDVVITNTNPDATLPLSEEEVLVRNTTTGVWENKPVSDLPSSGGITTETDPTVDPIIKAIPVSADAATNKYLNWNGSTYARKQIAYSEISGTPTIPTDTNLGNTDLTLAANRTITGNNKTLALTGGRWEESKGANIAAANDLTLGDDGNTFAITGNTQINAITNTNWQAGSKVILLFTGTPTIKHNTAGGAGTSKIILSGSADYTAAADDVLVLFYDGTNWHETTRKIAATGGGKGVNALANIGATPNAQGASISGSTLTLQPASSLFGGVVTTINQTFAGTKDFSGQVNMNAGFTATSGRLTSGFLTIHEIGSISTPAAGRGVLYAKNDGLPWYKNSAGTDFDLSHSNTQTATDANFTLSVNTSFQILPTITANRTMTIAAGYAGKRITLWNKNSAGFTWNFSGTVVDAAEAAITSIPNDTIWQFISDGTNWIKL